MRRCEWPGEEHVDFHLPHGEMLQVLRQIGFEVQALHELQAPEGPDETPFFVSRSWGTALAVRGRVARPPSRSGALREPAIRLQPPCRPSRHLSSAVI